MLLERRAQMLKNGRLPIGYREVEWIEGTGTQYIDTQYIPTGYDIIHFDATMSFESGANVSEGVLEDIDGKWARLHVIRNDRSTDFYSGYDINNPALYITGSGANLDITFDQNNITVNGRRATITSAKNITIPFYLFKRNKNVQADTWTGKIRKSFFRVRDNNSVLVRDMVPCYRKADGVIGMYDLCGSICPLTNSSFYINAGTGIFTKGADV